MILETATFIAVGSWLGNKLLDKGFDSIHSKITSKTFTEKFYVHVQSTCKILQKDYPDVLGSNIGYFFKDKIVFNELVKLLFTDSKVNIEVINSKFEIQTLPDDYILRFINILKSELLKDELFSVILSNKEIYLMVLGLDRKAEEILKISSLTIAEIKNLKEIVINKSKSNFSVQKFLKKYKSSLLNNFTQLSFIGLGLDLNIKKGKRKKLDDLFVQPSFTTDKSNIEFLKSKKPEIVYEDIIELSQVFDFDQNLIILGNPGSGKSVLAKFICSKVINHDQPIFKNTSVFDRIPFRIELRKYHAYKKTHNEGLIKYLTMMLEFEYGLSNVTASEIQSIIFKNKTLWIFDGLDEIFDIADKLLIKNDIENFIDQFKNAVSIVTSRIIGYDDAPLQEDNSVRLIINNFSDFQIENYIRNWYSVEEEDKKVRRKEIDDFLSKKEMIDQELISNPLLLSLIVILYRNNLKVPESKLEIYQSCTKTLVDKWDSSKDMTINISDEIYKRKDTVFADLAYWQYKELSKKDGKVTYQRALSTVSKSLTDKLKIADEFTSDHLSEQFMLYAQKRSLYFDNNFTHKTFLEYFTAFWIFSNIEKKHKKSERDSLIQEYITNPYWHIVLELLINLIDKDQADNEIIDDLVGYQLHANNSSSTFFLQIINSIQNISNSTLKLIVKTSIYRLLNHYISNNKSETSFLQNSPFYLLSKYYKMPQFKKIIDECIVDVLENKKAFNNNLILYCFYLELTYKGRQFVVENSRQDDDVAVQFSENLKFQDPFLFLLEKYSFYRLNFDSSPIHFASVFLKSFGVEIFLKELNSKFSNFLFFPVQYTCIINAFFNTNDEILSNYLILLESHGISLYMILENCFKQPFFFEENHDFKQFVMNFNRLDDDEYLILIVPLLYKLRFEEFYDIESNVQIVFQTILDNLDNREFANKLVYITNQENRQNDVRNYISKSFNIDSHIIDMF